MLCNDARLRAFLSAPEESGLYREVSQHVEKCHRCCERLLELSDAGELLSEACETLRQEGDLTVVDRENGSSSVLVAIDSLQGTEVPIDFETVPLDFLAPASHPEMLGRLGRYEIEKVIGTGGMGIVLKGYDTELHRIVAVKVLLPHLANSGAARRRFSREAQSAAAVVHEHVIPIYNVESDGDIPYLVMQYVPGQSLQGRVDEHGPLSIPEILRIGRQAAAGLAAAHDQGVVHRDVKPANLLLEESLDRVLISDFGLARTVDDATLTRTGIVAGTPHYMSPEQAGGEVVDRRTDLFSLGSVLYFMATGRPPFRADSPMAILNRICHEPHRPVDEINSGIPVELADLIERLLAKTPAARFESAREVEARLSNILSELQQGGRLRRRSWWRRWSRVVRHWRKAAQLASAGVLCILLGVLLASGLRPRGGTPTGVAAAAASVAANPDAAAAPAPPQNVPLYPPAGTLAPVIPAPQQWGSVAVRQVDIDTFELDRSETARRIAGLEESWRRTGDAPEGVASDGVDSWDQERLAIEAALNALTSGEPPGNGVQVPLLRWSGVPRLDLPTAPSSASSPLPDPAIAADPAALPAPETSPPEPPRPEPPQPGSSTTDRK